MFNSEGNSRARLQYFVADVQQFLHMVIRERSHLFRADLRKPLSMAWESTQPRFEVLKSRIASATDETLSEHGLLNAAEAYSTASSQRRERAAPSRGSRSP